MEARWWLGLASVVATCLCWPVTAADRNPQDDAGGPIVLHLGGDPYDAGKAHGERLARGIRAAVKEAADSLDKTMDAEARRRRVAAWRRGTPAVIRREIQGIAEGAGVPVESIELLQIWLETGLRSVGLEGAAFGPRTVGGKLVHWLSTDQPRAPGAPAAATETTGPILVVRRGETGPAVVGILPSPGAVGYLAGINARGLSASLLTAAEKPSGRPNGGSGAALVCRSILADCTNLAETERLVRSRAERCAGILLVGDGKVPDARVFEVQEGKVAVYGAGDAAENHGPFRPLAYALRRSNQYVHWPATPTNPAAGNGGNGRFDVSPEGLRYRAMTEWLSNEGPLGTLAVVDWLRSAWPREPLQVVLAPSDLSLWVGGRDSGGTGTTLRRFDLDALVWQQRVKAAEVLRTTDVVDAAAERLIQAEVLPEPRIAEASLPEVYRLSADRFAAEVEPWLVSGGVVRSKVRFPSPLLTPETENNTVHAELFRPVGPGPFPCVIVLHIAGGDFELSRFAAQVFAQRNLAALFVKMPYYGERRPVGRRVRMVSNDLEVGLRSMRQVVLDLRRACDWIEAQPSLDGRRIGVMGISLGAITGALAAAIEPRISHACLVMGGAELEHILFESVEREAVEYRKLWQENGGTRESFAAVMKPFDPATYTDRLRQRTVLMISADDDQTIPKQCTLALWEATGRQRIVWYPCGHYTMAKYLVPALTRASDFFEKWPAQQTHD